MLSTSDVAARLTRLADDADWECKRCLVELCRGALLGVDDGAARLRALGATCNLAVLLVALLQDSARLVRIDAARALLDLSQRLATTTTMTNDDDVAAFVAQMTTANLRERIEHDLRPVSWNTDFDELDDPTTSLALSDSDADTDGDEQQPLDCD